MRSRFKNKESFQKNFDPFLSLSPILFLMASIRHLLLMFFLVKWASIFTQTPFSISLNPIHIQDLGGVQSFAIGQHNGYWLIVGGRLDGLHRRQPFASFDLAGHNNRLMVVHPVSGDVWYANLDVLSTSLQEHLSSTNMQFYQEEDTLICMGGYGISKSADDHITFPYLTTIDLPNTINAVIEGKPFDSFIQQYEDEKFRITGGKLRKIDDLFYLLGGQKFMGRYNPMGAEFGPGFVQEYLSGYRVFDIKFGASFDYDLIDEQVDSILMRKRDFNAESIINAQGEQEIIMYSGVFRPDADLPWLNAVRVTKNGWQAIPQFQQYFNHYHCPVISIYDEITRQNHTLFFGGISQFKHESNLAVQDNNVPFVNTIARVTNNAVNETSEYVLPISMTDYFGAAAEFIIDMDLMRYNNNVIDFKSINKDSCVLGYIYGGIRSDNANIFFQNEGDLSEASTVVFQVYLHRNPTEQDVIHSLSSSKLQTYIEIDDIKGRFALSFNVDSNEVSRVYIYDIDNEKLICDKSIKHKTGERYTFKKRIRQMWKGSTYQIIVESGAERVEQRLYVEY